MFVLLAVLLAPGALASGGGKLLGTGGVSQFEGAAGGGLTPWALIGGNATKDEIGGRAFYTRLDMSDYDLQSAGLSLGLYDRLELSYTRQRLGVEQAVVEGTAAALINGLTPLIGPPPNNGVARSTEIGMDVIGLKVKLFGDAIYDQDSWLPQVALGLQHKRNKDFDSGVNVPYLGDVGIPALLGAADDSGTDYYLSATKAVLGVPAGYNLLANVTVRATKANAFGLLGFGREVINPLDGSLVDTDSGYDILPEASLALFLDRDWVVGAEWRKQSSRLSNQPILGLLGAPDLAAEDDAWDVFVAWFPSKRWSLTAAWVEVGNLPFQPDSNGVYLSLQASF
jgi:hypothetical protein